MRCVTPTAGLVAASLALGSACSAQSPGDSPARQADIERRAAVRENAAKPLPERVPEPTDTPVVGEVPEELLARIRNDLAARTGADPASFGTVRTESVTWNDGSLGCPQRGEFYTQAPVPGYRVVLSHDGQEYDYRAAASGYFRLCPATLPAPPPASEHPAR
jgi:hypothetical protein